MDTIKRVHLSPSGDSGQWRTRAASALGSNQPGSDHSTGGRGSVMVQRTRESLGSDGDGAQEDAVLDEHSVDLADDDRLPMVKGAWQARRSSHGLRGQGDYQFLGGTLVNLALGDVDGKRVPATSAGEEIDGELDRRGLGAFLVDDERFEATNHKLARDLAFRAGRDLEEKRLEFLSGTDRDGKHVGLGGGGHIIRTCQENRSRQCTPPNAHRRHKRLAKINLHVVAVVLAGAVRLERHHDLSRVSSGQGNRRLRGPEGRQRTGIEDAVGTTRHRNAGVGVELGCRLATEALELDRARDAKSRRVGQLDALLDGLPDDNVRERQLGAGDRHHRLHAFTDERDNQPCRLTRQDQRLVARQGLERIEADADGVLLAGRDWAQRIGQREWADRVDRGKEGQQLVVGVVTEDKLPDGGAADRQCAEAESSIRVG
eukprot:m.47963 g.47963  ORF g.47963 m.47963 type:complete len:430 (-) comp6009_c0_seq1:3391-4680(-)